MRPPAKTTWATACGASLSHSSTTALSPCADRIDITPDEALALYDEHVAETFALMKRKNHDYGEAWRDMRVSSYTDFILTKIERIKEIEDHCGETLVSEGIASNYMDIINYALFGIIRIDEQANQAASKGE